MDKTLEAQFFNEVKKGNVEKVNILLKVYKRLIVNRFDANGQTALNWTVKNRPESSDMIALLIKNGAKVGIGFNCNIVKNDSTNIANTDAGASTSTVSNIPTSSKYNTVEKLKGEFFNEVKKGNVEKVNILLKDYKRLIINSVDANGQTALNWTVNNCPESSDMIALLIKNGAKVGISFNCSTNVR